MSSRRAIPVDVDDLTAPWFAEVLARDVSEATVLERSSGTTGRARVALRGEPATPATVFVKLPPFDERQRVLVDKTGMGVAEARFYRDLAPEVPVRVPGVWFAATDDDAYVMVLEDLTASGCTFPTTADVDIEHRMRDIVEQLASLHAQYWDSDRFAIGNDLDWLATRGTAGGDGGRRFIQKAVDGLGDEMDAAFHRIADIYLARTDDIVRLWGEGTGTLVHGDSHLGNLFVDVAGGDRTGFLDWAVLCRAPGIRDVAYVLCNSVPPEIRAAHERALVDRYCALLAGAGIDLDPGAAWDQYRLFAVYSWVAATATAGMGSKWQPIEIGLGGTRRATAACAHIDSAGLLERLLG
jgi:aminoglycoside phosphotransferase (APT) family kinase protein